MDNLQKESPKPKKPIQNHGAHSGSRSGISDYNDGGNMSHYNGNDESWNFTDQEAFEEGTQPDNQTGQVAFGNDGQVDDIDDNEHDHGKEHSGL